MGAQKARARVVVSGRVQGVFFRQETAQQARSLAVAGWVRNRADGRVEGIFEGRWEAVEALVRWCGQGPSHAVVDSVEVAWEAPAGERGFSVR